MRQARLLNLLQRKQKAKPTTSHEVHDSASDEAHNSTSDEVNDRPQDADLLEWGAKCKNVI